jgi:hypothetical protein
MVISLKFNVTLWHKEKTAKNYRQLINVEKIDYCPNFRNAKKLPWFQYFMEFTKEAYPELTHDCPYVDVMKILKLHRFKFNKMLTYLIENSDR